MERVADLDETGTLHRAVGIDRSALFGRFIGDDPDGVSTEVGQRADHRAAEVGLHLEELAVVDDHRYHLAHVVETTTVDGYQFEQLRHEARTAIGPVGRARRRVAHRGRREVAEVRPDQLQCRRVVGGNVVHRARSYRNLLRPPSECLSITSPNASSPTVDRQLEHRTVGGHHGPVRAGTAIALWPAETRPALP